MKRKRRKKRQTWKTVQNERNEECMERKEFLALAASPD